MIDFIVDLIQSLFLIIAAIIIIIAAIGILRLRDDMDKVIYVRMHMFGMMDIACVLALIGLGQYLLAGMYFILAPFLVHAMANAYYYSEDERKYEINDKLTGRIEDNKYNKIAVGKNKAADTKYRNNIKNTRPAGTTNGVIIKEVSTDDIEKVSADDNEKLSSDDIYKVSADDNEKNSTDNIEIINTDNIDNNNLNQERGEKYD